jgi:hypothetical protein
MWVVLNHTKNGSSLWRSRKSIVYSTTSSSMPTLLSPVRNTLWPLMNDERPAVQLCSP